MSMFKIQEAKIYGVYSIPKRFVKKVYYLQEFIQEIVIRNSNIDEQKRIIIGEGFWFKEKLRKANALVTSNFLRFIDRDIPQYNMEDPIDNEKYLIHGVDVKVLLYKDCPIAIGSIKENFWIDLQADTIGEKIVDIEAFKAIFAKRITNNFLETIVKLLNKNSVIINNLKDEKLKNSLKKLHEIL